MSIVTNKNGKQIDFSIAFMLMDEDIRQIIANGCSSDDEQNFLTQYEEEYEFLYGRESELSK